jgi:hypothetical protein
MIDRIIEFRISSNGLFLSLRFYSRNLQYERNMPTAPGCDPLRAPLGCPITGISKNEKTTILEQQKYTYEVASYITQSADGGLLDIRIGD